MTDPIAEPPSILRGPKVILMGDIGTGKTHSLGTIVDWCAKHGKEVFVLFTDQGLESLLGYWTDHGKEVPPNLHWREVIPQPLSAQYLLDMATKVGQLSYEALTKVTDPDRSKRNAHVEILRSLINFKDDRAGKEYGDVLSWGTDRVFAVDNLSEVAEAIIKMTIGARPTMAPADYGVAQNNLMNWVRTYASGKYTFVLISHTQEARDETTGTIRVMVKGIGQAISSDIPKQFSDVIHTVREGKNWYWDTAASRIATKTRNLPIESRLKPDFGQIMDKWLSRGGK